MPLYIAKSGDLDRCYRCLTDSLTHSLTTLKDRATQLLIKYKSGALVTQLEDELVCQLAVDVYGHIGSIDDSSGFLGDSGGVKKVVM